MKAIEVIVEINNGRFWARVDKGKVLLTADGETIPQAIERLKDMIAEYKANEGGKDRFWSKVNIKKIHWAIVYDLEAFFAKHTEIKQSAIAERANINQSLIRQYATGKKHPSIQQAKKIESAIHDIANELKAVTLYAVA